MASCVERMAYTRGPTVALLIVGVLGPSTNRMQCLSLEQSSNSYAKKPLHHVGTKYSLQAVSCAQRQMTLYSNLGVVIIAIILNLLMVDLALRCTEDYQRKTISMMEGQNAIVMALHFTRKQRLNLLVQPMKCV